MSCVANRPTFTNVLRAAGAASIALVLLVAPTSASATGLRLPFVGSYPITQGPGVGDHVKLSAEAIDFGLPGNTAVYAAAAGTVIYAVYDAGNRNTKAGPNYGFGNLMVVRHPAAPGRPSNLYSYYAHLNSFNVGVGASVDPTTIIGRSGNTGNVQPPPPSGNHLHFEVRQGITESNPANTGSPVSVRDLGGINWARNSARGYLPGDIDMNGTINIFDYNVLIGNFGQSGCGNPADISGDCVVNIFDYNILVGNFGRSG